jgi:hypothetical protein
LDRSEVHFPAFLRKVFDRYIKEVEHFVNLSALNFCKEDAIFLSDAIVAAVEAYYNGFPSNAYKCLEQGLNKVIPHINQLINIHKNGSKDKLCLYKLRVNGIKELQREDMFHVPFENREFISMQRYNVPGLPCLYLGNSISVCWEEMQRPDIEHIYVSRYEIEMKDLHFLDISITPGYLMERYKDDPNRKPVIIAFITLWPLIAACSVNVLNNDAAFNPEYIIPQLLLQWVRQEKKIDGIKYLCTRVKEDYQSRPKECINYVIPCKEIAEKGFCNSLAEKVKLTKPISKSVLNMNGQTKDCKIIFSKLEERLAEMKVGHLKNLNH